METKFTKGEWSYYQHTPRTFIVGSDKENRQRIIEVIADDCLSNRCSVEEAEANAKLIAAAPDLLEIAMELFKTMSNDSHCVNKYASELMDLDKAIKKATNP